MVEASVGSVSESQPCQPGSLRNYFIYFTGQCFSILGSNIVTFAIYWYLVQFQSPLYYSIAMLMFTFPKMIVALFGGVWLDRISKKKAIIVADTVQACSTILIILSFSLSSKLYSIVILLLAIVIRSFSNSFQGLAGNLMVTILIPPGNYSRINGVRNFAGSGLRLLYPMISALLLTFMKIQSLIYIDFITYAIAMITFIPLRIRESFHHNDSSISLWQEFREGISTVRQNNLLRVILHCMLLNGFFVLFYEFLPFFVIEVNQNEIYYGILLFVYELGMISGSVILVIKKITNGFEKKYFLFSGLMFCFLLLFSLFSSQIIGYVCIFLSGLSFVLLAAMYDLLIRKRVKIAYQGRVYGVDMFLTYLAPNISVILFGLLIGEIGIISTYISVFTLGTIFSLLFIFLIKNISKIKE